MAMETALGASNTFSEMRWAKLCIAVWRNFAVHARMCESVLCRRHDCVTTDVSVKSVSVWSWAHSSTQSHLHWTNSKYRHMHRSQQTFCSFPSTLEMQWQTWRWVWEFVDVVMVRMRFLSLQRRVITVPMWAFRVNKGTSIKSFSRIITITYNLRWYNIACVIFKTRLAFNRCPNRETTTSTSQALQMKQHDH